MSIVLHEANPVFTVNRSDVQRLRRSPRRKIPLKTYQVTNDEQRFKLINKVVGAQQLTIREVNEYNIIRRQKK